MNGPDLLLPAPVQAAALPEVRNHTPYPSQYFQMMDTGDEVFHVIVSRITYDLTRLDEQGAPPLAQTDRKFNRMRPSMARVLGLETRSAKAG